MACTESRTVTFAIWGPIRRDDLPGLCSRVCKLLERSDADVALCDVDALARLQLGARRHGCTVRLRNATAELRALVAFMGLTDVLLE